MKVTRRVYISVLLWSLVSFLVSDKWYFAFIFLLGVVYPIIFAILLNRDKKVLSIKNKLKSGVEKGHDIPKPLTVCIKKTGPVLAVGMAEVQIKWLNLMTGEKMEQVIRFFPNSKYNEWKIPINTLCCGKIQILEEKVYLYDIFGILEKEAVSFENLYTMVYPHALPLKIKLPKIENGDINRDSEQTLKKGNDMTEIYDFRKYQPGDRLSSIHWKLSGKFDDLIVRQAGETIHTDILVMVDLSKEILNKPDGDRIFNLTASVVSCLCSKLNDMNVNFMMSYMSGKKIMMEQILLKKDIIHFMEKWLASPSIDNDSEIIKYFNLGEDKKRFSNIIYITGMKVSDRVYDMADSAVVHAVCVTSEGERIGEVKRENCRVTEIPFNVLEQKDVYLVL